MMRSRGHAAFMTCAVAYLGAACALGGCDDAKVSGAADAAAPVPATAQPTQAPPSSAAKPSAPAPFAASDAGPYTIALDAEYAYWLEDEGGRVVRAPRAGGPVSVLASNLSLAGIRHAPAIVVDDANVYFISAGPSPEADDAGISRLPKSGGVPTRLVKGRKRASGIAQGGGSLFWADVDGIFRLDKATGAGARVSAAGELRSPCGIAADKTHVYWAETANGDDRPTEIVRAMHNGQNIGTVAVNDAGFACNLALDDASVYWIDLRKGAVMRSAKNGSSTTSLSAMPVVGHALTVDASSVYVLSERAPDSILRGSIWKVPVAGGAPMLLAIDEFGLNGLATDEREIFWTGARASDHHGAVRRLAK